MQQDDIVSIAIPPQEQQAPTLDGPPPFDNPPAFDNPPTDDLGPPPDYLYVPPSVEFDIPPDMGSDIGDFAPAKPIAENTVEQPTKNTFEQPTELSNEPPMMTDERVNNLTSKFTLAQLAGVEAVEDQHALTLARLHLLRDLKQHDRADALKTLDGSGISNGTLANISRAELVGKAIDAAEADTKKYIAQSLATINQAILLKADPATVKIPYLNEDKTLLHELLTYSKNESAFSNQLLEKVARAENSKFIRDQYKVDNPISSYVLGKQTKEILKSITGQEFTTHLTSREMFKDVVAQDLAKAKETNNYDVVIASAKGNADYTKSLDEILKNENKQQGKGTKLESYLNARIQEMKDNSSIDFNFTTENKQGKPELKVAYDKNFSKDANLHITNVLNHKDNPTKKLDEEEKEQKEKKAENQQTAEKQNQQTNQQPQGPYYFHQTYYGIKGFIAGLISGAKSSNKTNENEETVEKKRGPIRNFLAEANSTLNHYAGKGFDYTKDKAAEYGKKTWDYGKERLSTAKGDSKVLYDDAKNLENPFYSRVKNISKAEQAVYKPTHNIDGLNVSPRLRNYEFGNEMAKLGQYTQAMRGAMLNKNNAPLVRDKMERFHTLFNNTVNHLSEAHKPTYEQYKTEMPVRLEAKQHAIKVLDQYQDLALTVTAKHRYHDQAVKEEKYNELSRRSLGMTQKLATPTAPPKSVAEELAANVYKDSLFLKHYATDLKNRKSLGLDTQEVERRIEKRLNNLENTQIKLKQAMSGPFLGNAKNADEVKVSLTKVNEYMELSQKLQQAAFSEKGMKEKGKEFKDKAKDNDFSLETMLQNLQESIQKMIASVSNLFNRNRNTGPQ